MESYHGVVTKIRIIKQLKDRPLLWFGLTLANQSQLNCLIASHSLNFFADVTEGMELSVYGSFNQRKQFVVKKYAVHGKTSIMLEFENLTRQRS
ncbi:hypothetical protein [Enterococcus sp. LJL90]